MNHLQIRAQRDLSYIGFAVQIFNRPPGQEISAVMTDITFTNRVDPSEMMHPVMISEEAAQQLMQDLWTAGLRPKGVDASGEVASVLKSDVTWLRAMLERLIK